MALEYTLTTTITTSPISSDSVRLFHGGPRSHIYNVIQYGVNAEQLQLHKGTHFWMAPNLWIASDFGEIAQQRILFSGGISSGTAVLAADVNLQFLESIADTELSVFSHGYRFAPGCLKYLTSAMSNIEVAHDI